VRTGALRPTLAALLAVGATVALVLVSAAGGSASAGALRADPPYVQASTTLKELGKALDDADDAAAKPGDAFGGLIKRAENLKEEFIRKGFAGQKLLGCKAKSLIVELDGVDRTLAMAQEAGTNRLRGLSLLTAAAAAGNLSEVLGDCPGASNTEKELAKEIEAKIHDVAKAHDRDKLTEGELVRASGQIAHRKKKILKGERILGCDVVEIHVLIDQIDVALVHANQPLPAGANDRETARIVKKRRNGIRDAEKALATLTKAWQLVPCGGVTVPANQPPVITTFTARVDATVCTTCTYYLVGATDPEQAASELKYTWTKEPPPGGVAEQTNCGSFSFERAIAKWDHPNQASPPAIPVACTHMAADHPGWISVVVDDGLGATTRCTYKGGSAPTATNEPAKNCT
jgi:hypothetical protein